MLDRKHSSIWILWTLAALVLFVGNASAYVGPGAGMELVGYAMSLLAWIGVAFFTVLMWPVYSFLHWLRSKKKETGEPSSRSADTIS